ncbi:MAG: hypothetical protein ABIJ47_14355 [Candidatus Bathyarchaeota archaeon]
MSDPNFSPPHSGEYNSAWEKHRAALREHSPALQALHQREQDAAEATREMSREKVAETLGTTIVDDKTSKTVTFYGTVLNYTEEDQQNFSSNAPSSTGKSFVTGEVLQYFPEEDILNKGYTSPTAFFHENSRLCTADGEELPNRNQYVDEGMKRWEEANPLPPKGEGREQWKAERKAEVRRLKGEWDEIDKYYVVDLEGKILHFRDQPHDKLLQNLRPTLSHDAKIVECNITDKSKEGGNRTKKVLIVGYPTVHFNSVRFSLDDQERTRLWLTSPEITQDKFRKSLRQQSRALADRRAYKDTLQRDHNREMLKFRVRLIKESPVRNVIIRAEDADRIYAKFIKDHPTLSPRHQRDFPRIIAMIKAHALFNQWTRDHTEDGAAVYASSADIEEGFKLCEELVKSNELGLPPHVYRFHEESLKPALDAAGEAGLHRPDVSRLYYTFYHTRIGDKPLGNMIALLLETGLVLEETDPEDKRRKKLYSPTPGGEKSGTPETPNSEALVDDVAGFFAELGRGQVGEGKLYAAMKRRGHRFTEPEFHAILKGYPGLYELDGWTVTLKEAEP